MGTSVIITFGYTEFHREVTEGHRVKTLGLCGSPWFSVDLSVSSLFV